MTRRPTATVAIAFAALALPASSVLAFDLSDEDRQLVLEALNLHEFALQSLQPAAAPDGGLRVDVKLGDQPVTLLLVPHSIRAPGYRVAEIAADGTPTFIQPDAPATYRGVIEDDFDSRVAASFFQGRFAALIDTGESQWMTQSIADVLPAAPAGTTAVFSADQVDMSTFFCAVDGPFPAPHDGDPDSLPIQPRGVNDCPTRAVTIEMTADNAYRLANGGLTQSRIEAMINMVSLIYENNFQTRVDLIGVRINNPSDPWFVPDDGTGSVNAGALLDAFSNYTAVTPPLAGSDRDFAHLASGREFAGSTVGLAGVGTVCNGSGATAVNQWNSINLTFNATILAHEKGHNWGAGHDGSNGCPVSGYIMSPSVCSNCGSQPTQFSSCSVSEINPALLRSCVTPLPPTQDAFGAVNDDVTIPSGGPHLIDVLANDQVCINGTPTVVGTLVPTGGATAAGFPVFIVPGAGPGGRDIFDYRPHPAFVGTDTFTYLLVNGALVDSATVTIHVSASAAPPLCSCDCFTEYRDDTGSIGTIFFGPGVAVNWMNRFNVQAGPGETGQILQVSLASSASGGNTIRFVIWDDPNNDGQPFDAVPIATSPVVPLNTSGFTSYTFPLTDVGGPGDSFFVGASFASGQFPIGLDGSPNTGNRSWLSIGSTNIGQNFQTQATDTRLVIRAVGGAELADCNDNGIVDECDVAGFIRPDVNGNGVPDECDPAPPMCPCEFDGDPAQVDVFDLLAYLDDWFAGAAGADVDGAPGVDVFDLLAYLDCWFPASAGDPCP